MTREEQIIEASKTIYKENGSEFSKAISMFWMSAFIVGADWADKHQNNVWHPASEEPTYDENIIAIDIDGFSVAGIYKDYNGKGIYRYHCFLCEWDAVVKWAYIGDILQKGGEK